MKLLPKFASRFDFSWSEQDEAIARAWRTECGIPERPDSVPVPHERDRVVIHGHGLEVRNDDCGGSQSKYYH